MSAPIDEAMICVAVGVLIAVFLVFSIGATIASGRRRRRRR